MRTCLWHKHLSGLKSHFFPQSWGPGRRSAHSLWWLRDSGLRWNSLQPGFSHCYYWLHTSEIVLQASLYLVWNNWLRCGCLCCLRQSGARLWVCLTVQLEERNRTLEIKIHVYHGVKDLMFRLIYNRMCWAKSGILKFIQHASKAGKWEGLFQHISKGSPEKSLNHQQEHGWVPLYSALVVALGHYQLIKTKCYIFLFQYNASRTVLIPTLGNIK